MTFTLTSDTGALRTVTDAVGQDEPDTSLFWSSLDSPVCVAGDWHGDARWATAALDVAAEHSRLLLHVGDLGIWPGHLGRQYLEVLQSVLASNDQLLLLTPGSHEDYDQLDELVPAPELPVGFGFLRQAPRVIVLARGTRFTLGGRSVLSIGGANNIDRRLRVPGINWWAREQISDQDVEAACAGGVVEIMLSHDCPTGSLEPEYDETWLDEDLAYARGSGQQLLEVMHRVQPQLNVFGRHHRHLDAPVRFAPPQGPAYQSQQVCLDMNGSQANLMLLDPATYQRRLLPVTA